MLIGFISHLGVWLGFDYSNSRMTTKVAGKKNSHKKGCEGKETVLKNGNSVPGAARSSVPGV